MTIEEFAAITSRVIAEDGLDSHIPTAVFPERRHIMAFEGIPDGVELESASRRWAQDNARGGEEYLVVFRVDEQHFKVVRRFRGGFEERVFPAKDA